jgi:diguanylate cyclase (GGDEF)-like protein
MAARGLCPIALRHARERAGRWPRRCLLAGAATVLIGLAVSGPCPAATDPPRAAAVATPVLHLLVPMGIAAVLLLILWQGVRRRWVVRADLHRLRQADETLGVLLGATNDAVILADPGLRVRRFNPAAELLFGRARGEVLSAPVTALIPDIGSLATPGPGQEATSPRLCHLQGQRDGEAFPLRLRLRSLTLTGEPWLLILAEDLSITEWNEARLDFLETRDLLTGLLNRRSLEQRIAAARTDPRYVDQPHALCLIDVDRFKLVNGTCGHAAGDQLLRQLSQICVGRFAEAAAIARLGGDEFAVLFVGETAARAEACCLDLVRTLHSSPFTWQERAYDITVSVGLVDFMPAQGASSALDQADIACQAAKAQGGDRLHRYRPEDVDAVRRRGELALISTIWRALDDDRLRVMAQPIMPLQSGGPLHHEILVRMADEEGRPVAPETFIPAAERYVLMPTIDRWVLAHVLGRQAEQLRAWHERYPRHFMFAVNLSAATLLDEGFLPYVKRRFSEARVPYASLCFEVTETRALSDLGRARTFMQELCDLGASFAVDDFGTGFASYAYLRSLPIRYLKIDGSFVRNLATDPIDRAFVESIHQVARVLGLQTIAEWAETDAVVEVLRAIGVDFAQGYAVGPAVPLEDLRLHRTPGDADPFD